MSNISTVEAKLPPGFRFHPKDEELVCDYLMKKVTHSESLLMIEVDLNKCEPWEIPETACVGGKEWYFYSQRDRKYATGLRTNRATASGYWKATGKDRPIIVRKGSTSSNPNVVGMRKTLVFYQGRAPKGRKTYWVMHEFRLHGSLAPKISSNTKEDWVLCRVFFKNNEGVARSSLVSYYHETGSSSALMDSYITFDRPQPDLLDEHEQVPCFSILSQNQLLTTTTPQPNPHLHPNICTDMLTTTAFAQFPVLTKVLDPYSCDKKVLKAVLNQLTMSEENPAHHKKSSSVAEESLESYFAELGTPNLWGSSY
ncbi:hypothetical protein K2173_016719 [Erythroxylum novogranatense]|uniref:NAC domain-containing protein n=1 Tax=Erythroxylum novogranatense TaxID=1862640 RepID=A0AAV8SS48_9ROSI|nr:hypothetical protein K2173_016719 [Erythroxylum novogranatense]